MKTIKKLSVLVPVFMLIMALYTLFTTLQYGKETGQTYGYLAEVREAVSEGNEGNGISKKLLNERWLSLYRLNPEYSAWITIDNTQIDYPVMKSPDDNWDYYLHKDFNRKNSFAGCLFWGYGCTADDMSAIIHGHNMRNGSMFGELKKFRDEEFYKKTPTFTLETKDEFRTYEIMYAFEVKTKSEDKDYPYYTYVGDIDEEEFDSLIGGAEERKLYDTGITPAYGDRILILSTCTSITRDGRFVVIGRETEESIVRNRQK